MPASAVRRGLAALLGCVAAVGLAGCEGDDATGPPTEGLAILVQELTVDGGGCRLKVTVQNQTGSDQAGIMVFNLVGTAGTSIGSGAVFPAVPNGTTRLATSDLLVATPGNRQLACSEIAAATVDKARSNVPIL
jgi:hypothetical protein